MKTSEKVRYFFRCVSWSWFVLGLVGIAIEFVRPSFVDYLIPLWVIFLIAAISGIISVIHKSDI